MQPFFYSIAGKIRKSAISLRFLQQNTDGKKFFAFSNNFTTKSSPYEISAFVSKLLFLLSYERKGLIVKHTIILRRHKIKFIIAFPLSTISQPALLHFFNSYNFQNPFHTMIFHLFHLLPHYKERFFFVNDDSDCIMKIRHCSYLLY